MAGFNSIVPNLFGPSLEGAPDALRPLLDVQPDTAGRGYHLGKLRFDDGAQAQQFITDQSAKYQASKGDQRSMQRDTLDRVERAGIESFETPALRSNRTIDDLLTPTAQVGNGSVQFGSLTVRHDEVDDFKAAERALAARNPEAVDTLAQLESQPTKTALIHGAASQVVDGTADQKLRWAPHWLLMYNSGQASAAPTTGLLHEEVHATESPAVRSTLANIPNSQYNNLEERRLIEGAEARDMALLGKPARTDHEGRILRATSVDSTAAELAPNGVGGADSITLRAVHSPVAFRASTRRRILT